ncbi:hypothetical protein [Natronolimnohabitans innermongolicus]|uniref:Exonuclease RecJ n=1 Tax=Natronolimnohabitans innermongolicus JCM 12255 TaxID=1227499 RepID=L9XHR1_9EURY|nr:hypothetical protein [Natronolimnohabitans innermongolicus]ELY61279.1 hypothetical protein C493_02326 [Natronolimnohabitans innermongolicus JCM 12255]
MATDGRSPRSASAPAPAAALEGTGFVHVVARADGDALAASGLLARALAARGTAYQVSVARTVADRTARIADRELAADDATVAIGAVDAPDIESYTRLDADDRPATLAALETVRELDATPDHGLALAGLVAAGVEPGAGESEWVLEAAAERGLVERRPGVAIPTDGPVDGLAHTTRLRAPWSGDVDATRDALTTLDVALEDDLETFTSDDHRAIGSLVALDAVGDDAAEPIAAETIQRALRPYATPEGPFATIGGYADVLEATAREEPGTGAALAMGHDARDPALDAWREHGRRAHGALSSASTSRYDGLFAIGIDDGPVEAVARLAAATRSPEPTVLVTADGEAAIATRGEGALGATVEAVARELAEVGIDGVAYDGGRRRGYLRYDASVDRATIVQIVRDRR